MRRSIFSIFLHTRFTVDELFYSRLTFVLFVIFCTVVVACNSHVNDKKKIGCRWWYLTAQSKIVLDSKCVFFRDFCEEGSTKTKKGKEEPERIKENGKKTTPNIFAQARNLLEFFFNVFVCLCVIYRFSTYYLGWTKCVVSGFDCLCQCAWLFLYVCQRQTHHYYFFCLFYFIRYLYF